MDYKASEIETFPYQDQNAGTSGLRKKCQHFLQKNYTENFLQSIFSYIPEAKRRAGSIVIGGDGRYYCYEATKLAVKIAAANKVKKVIVCQKGLVSTPAISHIIRKYSAIGGIIFTASHNPGGPSEDFGIKYNIENGGGAPENVTADIFESSKKIKTFHICTDFDPSIDEIHTETKIITHSDNDEKLAFELEIIHSTHDYVEYMKDIFDLQEIKDFLIKGSSIDNPFRINIDGRNGIAGPYIRAVFGEILGCPEDSLSYATPLTDFGGKHPDPNLTYAADFVTNIKEKNYDFGAAFDGDADRCMILGRDGFFVSPSDSVAVIAANAVECIPYFRKKQKLNGAARSMPTSSALDRVMEEMIKQDSSIKCYEVPTGWKFFCNLMDDGRIDICGEESFGAGSTHIREKDGVWVSLAWLSILAHRKQSIESIMIDHWKKYGRNFYTRYDYEGLTEAQGADVMNTMKSLISSNIIGKTYSLTDTEETFEVKVADNFCYNDPVDGSTALNQGYRIIAKNKSRIITRLSGTGSSGSTVRIYIEHLVTDAEKIGSASDVVLKPLVYLALKLTDIQNITGRTAPSVIT